MSRLLMQALLGLLFLAWLPVCADAGAENPFLLQIEESLSLSAPSDDGELGWGNGEGGTGALILPRGVRWPQTGLSGAGIRQTLFATLALAEFLSVRPATGPPAV